MASIEAAAEGGAWGVVYDMTLEDWAALHPFEGHLSVGHPENRYDLVEVDVRMDCGAIAARTYIAMPDPARPDPGLTSVSYLRQLIDGALAHGLPAEYIAMLRAVPTLEEALEPKGGLSALKRTGR